MENFVGRGEGDAGEEKGRETRNQQTIRTKQRTQMSHDT